MTRRATVLSSDPESLPLRIAELVNSARYREAIDLVRERLSGTPKFAPALALMIPSMTASLMASSGSSKKPDEMLECAESLLEIGDEIDLSDWYQGPGGAATHLQGLALYVSGVALAIKGDLTEARLRFDRAIALSPRNDVASQAWRDKAASYFNVGRYDEALECAEKAVSVASLPANRDYLASARKLRKLCKKHAS